MNMYTSSIPYSRKFLHDKIFADGSKSKSVKILSHEISRCVVCKYTSVRILRCCVIAEYLSILYSYEL